MDRIRRTAIPQAWGAVNFARPGVVPLTARGARRRHRARACVARRLLAEPPALWVLLHRGLAEAGGAGPGLPAPQGIPPVPPGLRPPPRGPRARRAARRLPRGSTSSAR